MTKSDLIDVLCETQKLPKGRAELLVHVIFDALEAAYALPPDAQSVAS